MTAYAIWPKDWRATGPSYDPRTTRLDVYQSRAAAEKALQRFVRLYGDVATVRAVTIRRLVQR